MALESPKCPTEEALSDGTGFSLNLRASFGFNDEHARARLVLGVCKVARRSTQGLFKASPILPYTIPPTTSYSLVISDMDRSG
jgi:hypothetical protein